jgi:hypothetical protein
MEERIEPVKQGKLKNNITRFRQDKRLAVTGALYSLALIGMLACVVFGIVRYHESLRPENLSRLASYAKAASTMTDPFTHYDFEAGLNTVYEPFGAGLAVASGDTYSFVSGLGDSSYSIQLRYNDPAIRVSRDYVLLYDRNGTGFCVANGYAEYLNENTDSPILTAAMNQKGDFALVTDQTGYRSAVTVYDSRQRLLCQWLTAQYYVMTASVSPDGEHFAALCLGQNGMALVTRVLYFAIGEEQPAWTVDLGEKQVYSITHDKSGGLVIVCDDGVARYQDGQCTASLDFDRSLRLFSAVEGSDVLLAFEDGSRGTFVQVLGNGLSPLWSGSYTGLPRAIDCRGGTFALLMTDRLETVRYVGETIVRDTRVLSGPRDVAVSPEGDPILFYSDRAEKVLPEEENE